MPREWSTGTVERRALRRGITAILLGTTLVLAVASASAAEPSASPSLSAPACGSPLAGASVSFTWSDGGAQPSAWWLYVGSGAPGANDLYDSGRLAASARSVSVSGLPTDGRTIQVRLFFFVGGTWQYADCSYQAANLPLPALTSPACGATLAGASDTFGWSDNGNSIAEWWLYLGTSAGARDLFDSGSLGGTSLRVTGLPGEGQIVHVRLWYRPTGGAWRSQDCTVTAATLPAPALTSPLCGATLAGTSETFAWSDAGIGVTRWWLYLGTSPGGRDVLDSGQLDGVTSLPVSGLPGEGQTLHARLWYWPAGGPWRSRDCTLTAATLPAPALTSPACGTALPATSATFEWTDNGKAVAEWWLYVGTRLGATDILDSGSLGASVRALPVSRLPDDGRTVYVRLFHRSPGAGWRSTDCTFAAANLPMPSLTLPACGSRLSGSIADLQWVDAGSPPSAWWVYVGSSPGRNDLFDSGPLGGATRSLRAGGLPIDGRAMSVRLFWLPPGPATWRSTDCPLDAFAARRLYASGTFAGAETATCSGTGVFTNLPCPSCTSSGTFDAAGDQTGSLVPPPAPLPDLTGDWIVRSSTTRTCPGEAPETSIDYTPIVQLSQTVDQLSGAFDTTVDWNELFGSECSISCPVPGSCSVSCPGSVQCRITCNPATQGCGDRYQIAGSLASATDIDLVISEVATLFVDCGFLGGFRLSLENSTRFQGSLAGP